MAVKNSIEKAYSLFEGGAFGEALSLYESLRDEYKTNTFDVNIALCRKRLGRCRQSSCADLQERSLSRQGKESVEVGNVLFPSQNKCGTLNEVFDNIYLVSLERDVERRFKVQKQLMALGLSYQVFRAVDGRVGPVAEKYQEYAKRPLGDMKIFSEYAGLEKKMSRKMIESPGAMGYIFTYIDIIRDAKKRKFRNILVIEDDVIFANGFNERFCRFERSLPSKWKILHLGVSQYGWKSVNLQQAMMQGFYCPRIHETQGSFAIGMNESVYDELIENQMAFEAPFDHLPIGVLYEKYLGECFVAFPSLVIPDVSASVIRGGRNQYEHGGKMKWKMEDFCYPQKKLNVGIVLSSRRNVEFMSHVGIFDSAPFKVNLFYINDNGIQPLHDFDILGEDYFAKLNESVFEDCIISVDVLLEAEPQTVLTVENVQEAVENFLGRETFVRGFKILDGNASRVVESRVSVIITTYKRPAHLERAVESVLLQDYRDVELIVVDDNGIGSEFSDDTRMLVDKLRDRFVGAKLKYIQHNVNANGASARNTGILHSTGEYISFLDDDDIYLPGRVSKCVAVLESTNADVGAVYCGFFGWNSKNFDEKRFSEGDLTRELLALDYMRHYLCTNTATYKRSAVFLINGFDASYRRHQDLEFNVRFFQDYKIRAVKECLVRLSPEVSSVDNKLYGADILKLKNKFLGKFKNRIDCFDEEVRKEIYMNNWKEVFRYTKNVEGFFETLKEDFSDGNLQLVLMSEAGNKLG